MLLRSHPLSIHSRISAGAAGEGKKGVDSRDVGASKIMYMDKEYIEILYRLSSSNLTFAKNFIKLEEERVRA